MSRAIVAALISAAAGLCASSLSSSATNAGPPPAPKQAVSAIKKIAGRSAYLPTFLPPGYRYSRWSNESPLGRPDAGQPWFSVSYVRAKKRLVWTVSAEDPTERCGDLSIGHTTAGGMTVYWGPLGPGGRDAWRCVGKLVLDAFDHSGHMSIPILGLVVASGTVA